MSALNYQELNKHRGHKVQVYGYYDENVSVECMDCYEVLFGYDNEEVEAI